MNTALHLVSGLAIALPVATQSFAADTFGCTFTQECIDDTPCKARDGMTATLTRNNNTWVVTPPDGQPIRFTDLPGAPEGTLRLITTEIDLDADAAAMLSISDTGRAILSIHGNFLSLGVVTHLGTCMPKDG